MAQGRARVATTIVPLALLSAALLLGHMLACAASPRANKDDVVKRGKRPKSCYDEYNANVTQHKIRRKHADEVRQTLKDWKEQKVRAYVGKQRQNASC